MLLPLQNPRLLAEALVDFYGRIDA